MHKKFYYTHFCINSFANYIRLLFIILLAGFVSIDTLSAQYTTKDTTANWEEADSWNSLPAPSTDPFDGILLASSYNINGNITRNGSIIQENNVIINDTLIVNGDYTINNGQLTLSNGALLHITGNFITSKNTTLNAGSHLIINGNYTQTGGIVISNGNIITEGNLQTSSSLLFSDLGNLVVIGDIIDLNGTITNSGTANNNEKFYSIGSTSTISTPDTDTDLCTISDPGPPVVKSCNTGSTNDLAQNDSILARITEHYTGSIIFTPCNLSITAVLTNPSCNGDTNGDIDITVLNGNSPSFLWSNTNTTEDITNLAAGSYTIDITDGSCTFDSTLFLTEPVATVNEFRYNINAIEANPSCKIAIEQPAWTSIVNLTEGATTLTKSTGSNNWDAGAFSKNALFNNGYVFTVASETNRDKAFGISHTNSGDDLNGIEFAIQIKSNSRLAIWESGNRRVNDITTYAIGDTIKIWVENGVVKYFKNSTILYESSVSPSLPLYADVALQDAGGQLSNTFVVNQTETYLNAAYTGDNGLATIRWFVNALEVSTGDSLDISSLNPGDIVQANLEHPCFTTLASNYIIIQDNDLSGISDVIIAEPSVNEACFSVEVPVTFTSLENVEKTANGLSKFYSGNWDGNAFSFDSLGNNSSVYSILVETNRDRAIGLSHTDADIDLNSIEFAIQIKSNGRLAIWESGNRRANDITTYATGDTVKIFIDNGVVKYFINSTVLYESSVSPTLPLHVDVSLQDVNSTLNSVTIRRQSGLEYQAIPFNFNESVNYQWKLNGTSIGTNNDIFAYPSPADGDQITVEVAPVSCPTQVLSSNTLTIIENEIEDFGDLYIVPDLSAGGCLTSYQEGKFTDLTWVTTNGNDLTKFYSGNWDGGAFSYNTVNNNSEVFTTINETNRDRAIGLSSVNGGNDLNSIQFAVQIKSNGRLAIWESGNRRINDVTTYANGDTVKIKVDEGVIKYFKNSSVLYESSVSPTLPLYIDASLQDVNSTLENITIVNSTSGEFTATMVNGGANPAFQWQVNGVSVGTDTSWYANYSLNNNDQVTCIVTPDLGGCSQGLASSNPITLKSSSIDQIGAFYISPDTSEGACIIAYQQPSFEDDRYLIINDNNLQKYYSGNWDGGAFSSNIVNNNSWAYSVINETNRDRAFGLSATNGGDDLNSIEYAIQIKSNGRLAIWESGNRRINDVTTYASGDTVKITIENSVIRYFKNSSVLYQSSVAPSLPLHIDVSLQDVNSTLNDITIVNATTGSFTATAVNVGTNPTYQWQVNGIDAGTNSSNFTLASINNNDLVNCLIIPDLGGCSSVSQESSNSILLQSNGVKQLGDYYISPDTSDGSCIIAYQTAAFTDINYIDASGNNLRKFYSGSWDGGAYSLNYVNNNSIAYTILAETNRDRAFGLSSTNGGHDLNSIQYAIQVKSNGRLAIWESGNRRANDITTYASGDTLKLEVKDNTVSYYKNSLVLYESAVIPTLPMHIDVSLEDVNATLNDITIVNATNGTFTATLENGGASPDYSWLLNGNAVGTNSSTYSNFNLKETDVVTCVVTPDVGGCSSVSATSNPIEIKSAVIEIYGSSFISTDTITSACIAAYEDVTFINTNNVDVTQNNLRKFYSSGWDGNAFSMNEINNNNYLFTVINETNRDRAFGMSTSDDNNALNTIDFAMLIGSNGRIDIYESGSRRVNDVSTYNTGDTLKISIENNQVLYYRNQALLYTSALTPGYPLYVDVSLDDIGATLEDVTIVKPNSGNFTANTINAGASPSYQWLLNGTPTGNVSVQYSNGGLDIGDELSCIVTPDLAGCATGSSNQVLPIVIQNDPILEKATAPVIVCPDDLYFCLGDAITLSPPAVAGNCGIASVGNDAPGTFPVGQTAVTWTITDDLANVYTCVQNIYVSEVADISLGGNVATCEGDVVTLDAGVSDLNYIWSNGESTQSITLTANQSTNYYVQLSDTIGCTGYSDTIRVTISSIPIPNIGNNQSVCDGNTVTLDAGAYASYTWSNGDNTQTIDLTTPQVSQIYVQVSDSIGCTGNSDTIQISILGEPIAPTKPIGDSILCMDPANTTYTTTGGADIDVFDWAVSPTVAGLLMEAGNSVTVNWSSTWSGSANLFVRGYNTCDTSTWSDSLEIQIANNLNVSIVGLDTSYMMSDPAVTISGVPAGGSYEIFTGLSDNGDGTAIFNPLTAGLGTHEIIYNYVVGICQGTDTATTVVDGLPAITFSSDSSSANENAGIINIPLELTVPSAGFDISVDYTITGGTAAGAGEDYTLANGTATITAGSNTTNISIDINSDIIDENDETIHIELSNPSGGDIGDDTTHVFTILDDDLPPSVQFTQASLSGLESITPVNFVVELSAPSSFDITFDYTTADGTATEGAGNDYIITSGNLLIPAGKTSDTLQVTILEDAAEEANETFVFYVNNFSNASAGLNDTITYSILDNDGLGWEGPGGVGDFTNQIDVWYNSFYSDNLNNGDNVSVAPWQWLDQTGNGIDAYQNSASNQPTFYSVSPTWNNRPLLYFDNSTNQHLKIDDNNRMNTASGAQSKRTIIVVFRPGSDITSRQVIFEEGAGSRGLNIYIENGNLYIGGWNLPNDDGGLTTPWAYTSVSTAISTNTPYFAIMQFDFDDVSGAGQVSGSLNGVDLGALPGSGRLFPHGGNIGVGGMVEGSCFDDGTCPGGNNYYFNGYLAEFISGNIVYDAADLKILHNYLSTSYGVTISASENLYDYDANNGYELIGIGQINGNNSHNIAQGLGILRIENPSNMNDGEFMLTGHNNGVISTWENTEVPGNDANIVRVAREWRIDKQGGDIGAVDLYFDNTEFGTYFSAYSEYMLLIDADGDFTTGAQFVPITVNGSEYEIHGINLSKGDYITIARVRPTIEFSLAASLTSEDIAAIDVTVSSNYAGSSDITVDYQTSNGTADATQVPISDYNATNGTITILAGDTSANITLTINDDNIAETDETFNIILSNPSTGINLGTQTTHTVGIQDNDNSLKVQFARELSTFDEDAGTASVSVHLSEDNASPVSVDYSILSGSTAQNGGTDFTLAASGTINFAANDTIEQISGIGITDDNIFEGNETIIIELSNPINANIGDTSVHTLTIVDNDPLPELNLNITSASGAESFSPIQVEARLSSPSGSNVTFTHTVTGGTATSGGNDFLLNDGTVTIPAGQDSVVLLIDIFNDIAEETNENFEITISNIINASRGNDSVFTYTIIDDDGAGWNGPGGVGNFSNQIAAWLTTSNAAGLYDGVKVSTGSALWEDFTGNGINAFQATPAYQPTYYDISPTWNNRPVIVFDRDANNHLEIADNPRLNTPSGAQSKRTLILAFRPTDNVTDRQVIYEEGGTVRGLNIYIEGGILYIGGWNKNNDDGGLTTPWNYASVSTPVSTNTPYFAVLTFDFDDVSGTGEVRGTLNGIDLGALPGAGKLFSHPGNIGVGGQNDGACFDDGTCPGGDRYFFDGYISEVISNNIVYNAAQLKIVNNYLAAKYNIALPASEDIYDYQNTHSYEVFGIGQENSAESHYVSQGSGVIKIENPSNAGNNRYLLIGHDGASANAWNDNSIAVIPGNDANTNRINRVWRVDKSGGNLGSIKISLDTTQVPIKTFGYTKYVLITDADGDFSSGSNVYELVRDISEYHSVSNINFNDGDYFTIGIVKPTIEFVIPASSAQEPVTDTDNTLPAFEVSLNYLPQNAVTVDYATADGTAMAGNDFTGKSGTITISGDTSATFNISVINDTEIETDETVLLNLSNPSAGITLGAISTHTFTINDDDNPRKVEFTNTTGSGFEVAGTITIPIEINLADGSNATLVDFTVTGGTASSGNDYTITEGTITFIAGSTSENLPDLIILHDLVDEDDETVVISLSNPVNCNLGTNTSFTYTITDNDDEPTISFSQTTGNGSESFNPAYFEVNLTAPSNKDITINYMLNDVTATGLGIDYNLAAGSVTIPAGIDSILIAAEIINDLIDESSESFEITLRSPVNAILGTDSVLTYTIYDDDGLGYVGPGGVGNETQYVIWHRASAEGYTDNASVNILTDFSGNGNNGTSSGGNMPTFQSDAGNLINGQPVILFDGTNDFIEVPNGNDVNNASYTLKTVMFAFKTGADVTSRQILYEEGGGSNGINMYIEGGELYYGAWAESYGWNFVHVVTTGSAIQANTEYYALFELDIPNQTLSGYLNGALVGTVATGSEELGSHGGNCAIGAQNDNSEYHSTEVSGDTYFFEGALMEFLLFNNKTNSADKKIAENYFAAKYRNNIETDITNDLFAYRASYGHEVFGIGQDDADNNRIISQGTGIIRMDNPVDLDNGDYIIIGHDNGTYNNWSPNAVPYDSIQRIQRTWISYETGDITSVRLSIDTTILPAKSPNYQTYVLLVDNNTDTDNDMSTGINDVKMYPMAIKSGAMRIANNVQLSSGSLFTIAIARNRTVKSGNWNDNSVWLLQQAPRTGEIALITDNDTIDLTGNVTVGAIDLGTGSILNINSHTLSLDQGNFNNNGTINVGTGTINYSAAGTQCIEPLSYHNLLVTGSGTKTLCGNITVTNDITINGVAGSLILDVDNTNNYSINLEGDWNNSATFEARNGTVNLTGTSNQSINRPGGTETFNNLNVETSGALSLTANVTVGGVLTMDGGNILTSTKKLTIGTDLGNPGNINLISGVVIGNLERWITSNNTYEYPISDGTNTRTANISFNNVTSGGSLLIGFSAITPGNFGLPQGEDGFYVSSTFTEGYWNISELNNITNTGGYNIELDATNFNSETIGLGTRIVARSNSFSDWALSGTHLDAAGSTIRRNAITMLPAHLAIADTSECNVNAGLSITDVSCFGGSNGAISIISPTGGSGVYEYSINGGAAWQASANFTGLTSNTYNVQLRDANFNGCANTINSSALVDQLAQLTATIDSTDETCSGNDGSILFSAATGGSGTYEYSINGGTNWSTNSSYTGLSAGNYTAMIRDANNTSCEHTLVSNLIINGTTPLSVSGIVETEPTCNGDSDGELTINGAGGGSGAYEYSINGGTNWQASNTFTGLSANTYNIMIRDANSNACELTVNGAFTLGEPAAITVNIGADQSECDGTTVTLDAGAGYSNYSWSTGASTQTIDITTGTNTYNVTVTDANTCTGTSNTVTVTINEVPDNPIHHFNY